LPVSFEDSKAWNRITFRVWIACRSDDRHPIQALSESELLGEKQRLYDLPKEVLENHEVLELMIATLGADCALQRNRPSIQFEPTTRGPGERYSRDKEDHPVLFV